MNDQENTLGLNFRHDGASCILWDGAVTGYAPREKHNRAKHAQGAGDAKIERALSYASLSDIDYVVAPDWISGSGLGHLAHRPARCLNNLRYGFHITGDRALA